MKQKENTDKKLKYSLRNILTMYLFFTEENYLLIARENCKINIF